MIQDSHDGVRYPYTVGVTGTAQVTVLGLGQQQDSQSLGHELEIQESTLSWPHIAAELFWSFKLLLSAFLDPMLPELLGRASGSLRSFGESF